MKSRKTSSMSFVSKDTLVLTGLPSPSSVEMIKDLGKLIEKIEATPNWRWHQRRSFRRQADYLAYKALSAVCLDIDTRRKQVAERLSK